MRLLAFDWLPILLGDQHAIRNVMRGMHNRQAGIDTSGLTTALLIFCLFFVSVWGIARVFIKPERGFNQNNAKGLFRELCLAHRLNRSDWWLLSRLAHYHRLNDPAMLFLEPRWLDADLCGSTWQRQNTRLRELQLTLFAGLASPCTGERQA